jgi:hypothetical protein
MHSWTTTKAYIPCSFCQHSPSLDEASSGPRILLVPEPAPRRVLLQSIKVAKTLDDTDASATPPRRRRRASQSLFAPASLHISAAQCLYWAWPIATPLQPCCGPALRQTENTKLASTCRTPVAVNHQNLQPPTLMTDANIVITSLRRISHSFVLSLAGSTESPTHLRPDLGPEALGSAAQQI